MTLLISKIHYLIILYSLFIVFEMYENFEMESKQIESELPIIKNQVNAKQRKLDQIKSYAKDIENAQARKREAEEQFKKLQMQLPSSVSDFEVRKMFVGFAKTLNIKDFDFKPSPEKVSEMYRSKKFKVTGEGTFLQFLIFIEQIAQEKRIYNIKRLELKRGKKKMRGRYQLLNASLDIETYSHEQKYSKKTDATKEDKNKAKKNQRSRNKRNKKKI